MRRRMMKALSLVLAAAMAGPAQAQDPDDVACEYGVVPYEPIPEPEPVPMYGVEEPIYLPEPSVPGLVINGVVRQQGTDQPLEGIQVTLGELTLLTDPDGRFGFTLPVTDEPPSELSLRAKDIDGHDKGGKHRSASLSIPLEDGALSPMLAEQGIVVEMKRR